jgi:drug/metabolite transporter (DMT)-like permease
LWLLLPQLQKPSLLVENTGPLLVLGSALAWAFGSFFLRYRRPRGSHLVVAGYQMLLGGMGLSLVGLTLGELQLLTPERFKLPAILAYFYLLVAGSLVGFVAYNWLLGHVSSTLAGTYAYVNPVVAIWAGWLLGGEQITSEMIGGMAVILAGVFLVRSGGRENVAAWKHGSVKAQEHQDTRIGACDQTPVLPHSNALTLPRSHATAAATTFDTRARKRPSSP